MRARQCALLDDSSWTNQSVPFTRTVINMIETSKAIVGGALVRNDLGVVLADEGADCTMSGLFLANGDQVVDNHTLVDHSMPHGTSRELYKGVLGDRARGVFRGRVIVRPHAQKTNATQSNANLLLSDDAEIDTKPQLEIYADDVKCTHGATIGQLDDLVLVAALFSGNRFAALPRVAVIV